MPALWFSAHTELAEMFIILSVTINGTVSEVDSSLRWAEANKDKGIIIKSNFIMQGIVDMLMNSEIIY